MKKKIKIARKISEDARLAVSVALVAVIIIFGGNAVGLFGSKEESVSQADATVSQTAATTQPITQPTTQLTTQPAATAPSQITTATPSGGKTQTTAPSASSAPSGAMTTAQIIALFNESANKVKTDATKVVKNFEKRRHNEEHLIVPKVLEGMAADLMAENFKDDTEPIVYATREEIVSQYQVPGVEWASQLTENEVASAKCTDNGNEYEVEIALHPTQNPEPGIGVAKAFDTITSSEIMAKAPSFITAFDTTYSDCVVKCKIDKATGKTTWSNYNSTVILAVKLTFLGNDLDAQVSMSFEKDYTITY